MSNVIETLLDEGLYYLEKERANITRDEKIFEINKKHINKHILDDIFTADGSILVLARYMINKIEKKKEEEEEANAKNNNNSTDIWATFLNKQKANLYGGI